ncbi:ATP-grasp domain-containing protein [Leptospira ilyithenensis]|uniref:Biotin carboxylase n=1 Tax=Leptospira ilyithenensis TaxID=2484901 RepID=A0A4R9LP54_9LEPT|nr:ATP-grasp domain-containing protein [Leptospira ilyithenensis]TGN10864.1 biotin carboxylase [Leptospira ilyithenensis]
MKHPLIAVSGMNAVDSPGPGVPVLRSLKESDLRPRLIGFAYGTLEPGNFMTDLLENSFLFPYPNAGPGVLLDRIRKIHSDYQIDVIIPTLDSELDNYISIEHELKQIGIKMVLPGKKELHTRDKTYLNESLKNTEVLLPETRTIQDITSLRQATEEIGFPLFMKGIFYEAFYARNYEEAAGYFYSISAKWGVPVIVQKYISGEECNVCALANRGELIGGVVMKKLFLTDKGKAWAGVTIGNEEVKKISTSILKFIGWHGGCELEFIIETKTGKMYLLEINPRFPAWIYLATASGQNLPDALVKMALGEPVPSFSSYEIGKVFVRHSWDEIIPMKQIETLTVYGQLVDVKKESSHE